MQGYAFNLFRLDLYPGFTTNYLYDDGQVIVLEAVASSSLKLVSVHSVPECSTCVALHGIWCPPLSCEWM